jgi:hydroxymethylpyrimidine/phosphomethylpyrimidine kinase
MTTRIRAVARTQHSPVALTIAGSDSGGGAGIQADLKVFHALGVFGTSAITCLTAQNPARVSGVEAVSPAMVAAQIARVCEAFPVGAAKTGMLYNAGIIRAVAAQVRRYRLRRLVVDPVMIATSGARLLRPDAVRALMAELLPLALVVTPNLAEAEALWGEPIRSATALRAAARELAARYGVAFVVKGGHLPGARVVDVLCADGRLHEFGAMRVRRVATHGTGCTMSAAIAGHLALGADLVTAVADAKRLVTGALRRPLRVGRWQALRI